MITSPVALRGIEDWFSLRDITTEQDSSFGGQLDPIGWRGKLNSSIWSEGQTSKGR
jgi:hypothetical protein